MTSLRLHAIHPRLLPALAALATVAFAAPAAAQDTGDGVQGRARAEAQCAECHAIHAGERRSPAPQAPSFQAISETPGLTRTALAVFFRTPHRTMPNLIIDPQHQDDLIAYILSLAPPR